MHKLQLEIAKTYLIRQIQQPERNKKNPKLQSTRPLITTMMGTIGEWMMTSAITKGRNHLTLMHPYLTDHPPISPSVRSSTRNYSIQQANGIRKLVLMVQFNEIICCLSS